jgi:hypothetical protein
MVVICEAPDRLSAQRLDALQRANDVRSRRAEVKRDIAACRDSVASVLAKREWWTESMWMIDLLLAAPRVGRMKATEALKHAGVSPRVRVGELTERQRDVLIAALERRPRH